MAGFPNCYIARNVGKADDRTLAEHGVPDNHVLTLYLDDGGVRYVVPISKGR